MPLRSMHTGALAQSPVFLEAGFVLGIALCRYVLEHKRMLLIMQLLLLVVYSVIQQYLHVSRLILFSAPDLVVIPILQHLLFAVLHMVLRRVLVVWLMETVLGWTPDHKMPWNLAEVVAQQLFLYQQSSAALQLLWIRHSQGPAQPPFHGRARGAGGIGRWR